VGIGGHEPQPGLIGVPNNAKIGLFGGVLVLRLPFEGFFQLPADAPCEFRKGDINFSEASAISGPKDALLVIPVSCDLLRALDRAIYEFQLLLPVWPPKFHHAECEMILELHAGGTFYLARYKNGRLFFFGEASGNPAPLNGNRGAFWAAGRPFMLGLTSIGIHPGRFLELMYLCASQIEFRHT